MFIHDLKSKHDVGGRRGFLKRFSGSQKCPPKKVADFGDFRINHYRGFPHEENSMHIEYVKKMNITSFCNQELL